MRHLPLLLAALLALPATAQDKSNDLGLDFGLGVEKRLAPRLDIGLDAAFRTQDNSSRAERWGIGAGLDYKLVDAKTFALKAGAGFELIWSHKLGYSQEHLNKSGDVNGINTYDCYWRTRTRTSLGLTAAYKPSKRWTFSLKETVQYNHYAADSVGRSKWRYNDDDELYLKETDLKAVQAKDRFVLRSKLTAEYNIKGLPLNPFASVDYGRGLNYNANKWKLTVGCDYKLDKRNRLSLYYRFQSENDDDEPNGHIVGLAYKLKL